MSTIRANAIVDSSGGNTATVNGVTVALASQAQAEAGTDNATLMTPLRAAQAISALSVPPSTAGDVGTYVWATRTTGTTDVTFGTTLAGSSLSPTSAARIVGPGLGGTNAASFNVGTALSGTWQCMGTYDHTITSTTDGSGNSQTIGGSTLWLRIS